MWCFKTKYAKEKDFVVHRECFWYSLQWMLERSSLVIFISMKPAHGITSRIDPHAVQ